MADIQNISITSTQTVPQPKPHTTYTIQVSTPTRTWTVSRRYNDFVALHAELLSSTGEAPPSPLPPKHPWSLMRSSYDEKIIRERKILLETYLRSILTHRDPRWRQSYTFPDFLSIPPNLRSQTSSSKPNTLSSTFSDTDPSSTSPPHTFTPTTWLLEYTTIQGLLRNTRSALLKRDALAGMGDASGSRSAGVDAKRLLRDIEGRVEGLEKGLKKLEGLGEGERKRREELVEGLKAERGDLVRMAEAGVRTSGSNSGFTHNQHPAPTTSSFGASSTQTMPGHFPASGRVFGKPQAPPQETAETRPLDDRGLLQLQQTKMDGQDDQLKELSRLLGRQKVMGEEIHREIGEQNDLLDDIDGEVDKVGGKMARAKRDMNKLS